MSKCPFSESKYHTYNTDMCIITPSDTESAVPLYYHTFVKAKYSIHPVTGKPLFDSLDDDIKTFNIQAFETNTNKCTLRSQPFDFTRFKHITTFRAETVLEFWNIVYNFVKIWITKMPVIVTSHTKSVHDTELMWPHINSALDILIDTNDSNRWKLLRPIAFTSNPLYFRNAVRLLLYQLFCNSMNSRDIRYSSKKRRPKNMKCDDINCKIYTTESIPCYNVFGKGNIIHSIVCSPTSYINDDWWNMTNAFIKYRMKISETDDDDDDNSNNSYNLVKDNNNYGDFDDAIGEDQHTFTASHLRHLHAKFKNSIMRNHIQETEL